jgi:hypothetical protein
MPLTNLTAMAVYAPEKCADLILTTGSEHDFKTRPLAVALGTSYPTLLRVLYRLGIRKDLRDLWKARRKENKAEGK